MVHMAHDGDNRRARDRPGGLLARLGGDDGDAGRGRGGDRSSLGLWGGIGNDVDGDFVAFGEPRRHFRAEFLVQRGKNAQAHQLFLDVGGGDADQCREIFQGDDGGDIHHSRRVNCAHSGSGRIPSAISEGRGRGARRTVARRAIGSMACGTIAGSPVCSRRDNTDSTADALANGRDRGIRQRAGRGTGRLAHFLQHIQKFVIRDVQFFR